MRNPVSQQRDIKTDALPFTNILFSTVFNVIKP